MFHVEQSRTILVHTLHTKNFSGIMLYDLYYHEMRFNVVGPTYLFFEYWSMLSIFATYITC